MNIQKNIPLSKLTTLEIGGPARELIEVSTTDELIEAITYARKSGLKTLMFGGGSNLLISDKGFDGLVIVNKMSGIKLEENLIKVKAGTSLQTLVDYTIEQGYSGMEKLTGIPGTIGGAVYGNAGAYGQTVSDFIESVVCINPSVNAAESDLESNLVLNKSDCNFSYRDSDFKKNNLIILEIHFNFPKANPEELKQESERTLKKRLLKYKPGIKCPGSFFKNVLMDNLTLEQKKLIPPERDTFGKVPAWFFLDSVDAKGAQKGNIEIANFHGNLFINKGNGSAQDFYDLAKEFKNKVKEKFGVELEPEVQLINLPPL